MEKKKIIGILFTIVIIIAAVVFILHQPAQPQSPTQIQLAYEGKLNTVKAFTGSFLTVSFQTNFTLFDCKADLSYQSANGTMVQVSKELGTIDPTDQYETVTLHLTDYPASNLPTELDFNSSNPLPTLQITAYGYSTPNTSP
jgi:hypothetical protein